MCMYKLMAKPEGEITSADLEVPVSVILSPWGLTKPLEVRKM